MDYNSLIANNIREKREAMKIIQSAFAKMIGMSASSYSRLENGEIQITINTLKKISDAMNVSVIEVLNIATSNTYNFNDNKNILQVGHSQTLNIHLTSEQFSQLEKILK